MNRLISVAGMLAVLAFAYGLDRVFEFLRQDNARTFQTSMFFARAVPLDLAFAASILALGCVFLFKSEKTVLVSVVFVVVGLLLLFSSPLMALFPTVSTTSLGQLRDLLPVSPTAYEYHAAAFVTVLGVIGLLKSATGFRIGTRAKTAASSM